MYLIFWGSQWGAKTVDANGNFTFSKDSVGAAPYVQQLMKGLGTGGETWSGTMTQYCDGPLVAGGATACPAGAPHVGYPTGGALAGIWYDHSAAEPTSASYSQLAAEAVKAAGHFGTSTAASNRYAQYVVFSAPGLDPDYYKTSGFCAWHSWSSSSAGDIAFTNLPYLSDVGYSCGQGFVNYPGTDDGYSIVEGHEYAETITDQLPDGGWLDSSYDENGDKCVWIAYGQGAAANVTMATGAFPMQSTFSNDTDRCDLSHPIFAQPPAVEIPSTGFAFPGSLGSTAMPVVEKWDTASDPNGICRYDLRESVSGGPFSEVRLGSPTATSVALLLDPSTSYRFELNVTNCLGESSGWGVQPSFAPLVWQESSKKVKFGGSWTTQSAGDAYGGALKYSTAKQASATAKFKATGVAWISETGPTFGKASVYLDGVLQKTLDLYSSTHQPRQIVWKQGWSTQQAHTLKIVVAGTAKRARVDVDAVLTFHLQ